MDAFRPITRRSCPFCGWFFDDPGPTVRGYPASMEEAIEISKFAFNRHLAMVESVLTDHVSSHVEEMSSPQ